MSLSFIPIFWGAAMVFAAGANEVAVILFGPTQAGKSTTFNNLCGRVCSASDSAEMGDGSGESVTVETSLCSSKIGLLLDTPGIDDSKLRFTNQEAGKKVALGVAAAGVKAVKFLVVESMANDAIALKRTLAALVQSFGDNVLASVVVLATKPDNLPEPKREKRSQTLSELAAKFKVPEMVKFQHPEEIDPTRRDAQEKELQSALDRVPATQTTDLEDLNSKVQARARLLSEGQAPLVQEQIVEVPEQYVEPREVDDTYTEEYVDYEERQEQYEAMEQYEGTYKQDIESTYVEHVPWVAKVLTLGIVQDETKTRTKTVEVPMTKWKPVTKIRSVHVPVTKTRSATRKKIVYDTKTRMKEVKKSVEVRRPVEDFVSQAREEVMVEIRQTLMHV